MKFFWINVNTSLKRKEYMIKLFNSFNIQNERIEAITPDTIPKNIKLPRLKNSLLEVALCCSHIKAINEAYKQNLNYAIICEDDLEIKKNINFNKLIESAPNNWNILQLLTNNKDCINKKYNLYKKNNKNIWSLWYKHNWSTGIYLINKEGMKTILDLYYKNNIIDFSMRLYGSIKSDTLIYLGVNRKKIYTINFPIYNFNIKFDTEIQLNLLNKDEYLNYNYKTYLLNKELLNENNIFFINEICLITNNCYGINYYKKNNYEYNTCFIGLFLYSPCYIKFLENYDYYINITPLKCLKSKYGNFKYPIGIIDNSIEIHFLHEKTFEEALDKWERRKKRMNNINNCIIKMDDRDLYNNEIGKRFVDLKFKNKILFLSKKNYFVNSCIIKTKYENECQNGLLLENDYPLLCYI